MFCPTYSNLGINTEHLLLVVSNILGIVTFSKLFPWNNNLTAQNFVADTNTLRKMFGTNPRCVQPFLLLTPHSEWHTILAILGWKHEVAVTVLRCEHCGFVLQDVHRINFMVIIWTIRKCSRWSEDNTKTVLVGNNTYNHQQSQQQQHSKLFCAVDGLWGTVWTFHNV